MKVKFTYQRAAGPVDLVATVDSAATVGDLARYLAAADPKSPSAAPFQESTEHPTLSLDSFAMNPRQPVIDSGLRSGSTVSLSRAGVTHSDPQRAAAAVLRILDGPDAGKEFQLPRGGTVIGRERGCDVRLTDSMVSRRHARINVGDVVEVVDLGSANGVQIDDLAVPRSILRSTDVVQIGDTRLSVRMLHSAVDPVGTGGPAVAFIRSPRVDPRFVGQTFEAPEPPERPGNQRFPVVMLIAPLLMGAVLYFVTKNPSSLIFIALSPLMLVGNNVEGRLARKSEYRRAVAAFREDVDSLVADLQSSATDEVAARLREQPSSTDCVEAVRGGTPLLWTRRPGEAGYGELRLGLGRRPSRSTIEYPRLKRSIRALFKELQQRTAPFHSVDGVPVVGDLNSTAVGVAGPRTLITAVGRALLIQAAGLHSPAELAIGVLASSHTAQDWDWLKWLPHTNTPQSPVAARLLTSSAGSATALVSAVEELIEQRLDASGKHGSDAGPFSTSLLLIIESDAPVEFSRLVGIAERGPSAGVGVLWFGEEVATIPAACRTFLEMGRDNLVGMVGHVHEGVVVSPVTCEQVEAAEAHRLARLLAPVVDIGARASDSSDLPRAVSLLSLTGTELANSPDAVLERWTENRSIITGPVAPPTPPRFAGTLRAVIGKSAQDVHALDLRVDGPHALVGGTTGAGKSELLQTWILAMAAAHSPQRLTFLLVDYKGGSAFRDCVDLPHTVGLVTDLSPHLVRRALTSLSAELRYREHLLARHAAKDLVSLEKQGVAEAPPSLVLVVDEFAALINEVPEFVDGVVNVAQRGRSLGLHLILATQRPTGVIKDNLRANTNLRLALRMSDEADSTDVLGSPEAAFFDSGAPGRAVSKTGPGRLVPFQTGYVGGWTSDEPPAPELLVEELTVGTPAVWAPSEPEQVVVTDPGPTDIRRIVDRIGEANGLAQIPAPRKPWLPELQSVYDLADQSSVPSRRRDTELVFGVQDSPDTQSQPTVAFFPDRDGSLAVYGTGGSGKSTLLRTIAIAAGFTVRGGPCQIYGIDFGARGLAMLEELPHVGSVISGGDHERITRLLGWLRTLIDDRALRYSRVNAGTITDYRSLGQAPDEPRIILLVDGVTAFRSAYESSDRLRWFEIFTSIVADGRPVGVHVVLSSDQRGGLTTALSSAVQARVVLRMANPEDYGMLGVPSDVVEATAPAGRGVIGADEIQVAVLGGTSDPVEQAAALRGFAESMRRSGVSAAAPIQSLPEKIALSSLPTELNGLPVIGIASNSLGPVAFEPSGAFVISGPPMSGRTGAMQTIATALRRADPAGRSYFFGSRRSPLFALDVWAGAWSAEDGGPAAERVQSELTVGLPTTVFIENPAEFGGSLADTALQSLVRQALADGALVVVEGETSTLAGSMGLVGMVKASRAGLALAPDPADGMTIYRTNFPRANASDRIPGRGFLVRAGRVELIQIAQTDG